MPKKPVKATKPQEPDTVFASVVGAFAGRRDVTQGTLFSSHGLKVGGKIFAMFGKSGFVVKLPKQRVDDLVGSGAGERFEPGPGRVMKEWVVVAPVAADWIALANEAYRFVRHGKSSPK